MEETIQKLYVEVSSRCNLRCKMCFRHSWVGERFGDLDPAVLVRRQPLALLGVVFLPTQNSLIP